MAFQDDLRTKLRQLNRDPFTQLLEDWLRALPDDRRLAEFARAYPDKAVQAVATIARMAGYQDKMEGMLNVEVNVSRMSDSQLEDALRRRLETVRFGNDEAERPLIEAEPQT